MSEPTDLDALFASALRIKRVRIAFIENGLRRRIASALDRERRSQQMTVREFAKAMGTSTSQIQRVRHREVGGSLSLSTIVRAADALGLEIHIELKRKGGGHE